MWCKTEQEGPGRLPDPPRKRGSLPGIGRRSARNRLRRASPGGETNDRPDPRREPECWTESGLQPSLSGGVPEMERPRPFFSFRGLRLSRLPLVLVIPLFNPVKGRGTNKSFNKQTMEFGHSSLPGQLSPLGRLAAAQKPFSSEKLFDDRAETRDEVFSKEMNDERGN